jgi:prepilin-type processing-associated H-X9-DG protein
LAYTQPSRFNKNSNDLIAGNSNYAFADTHAKNAKLSSTLNPKGFMWGTRNYGGGGGTIVDSAGNPVTN